MASEVQQDKEKAKTSESDKGKGKACWDPEAHRIFVDVCIEEVRAGNWATTHFNTIGWKNVVKKFNDATGREYNRIQMKNHWDNTKKEWLVWESLVGEETGLGWDATRQTVSASNEWWERKIRVKNPDVAKFRVNGLEHAFKLDELFRDVTATGARSWAPTSGQMPPLYTHSNGVGDEASVESDDAYDGDNVENTSTQVNRLSDIGGSIRKMGVSQRDGNQDKRRKRETAAAKLSRKLDRLCDAAEVRSSSTYVRTDKLGCSIKEVIDLLTTFPECTPLSELYMAGTRIFLKRDNREMFVALENPIVQLAWLKEKAWQNP